MFTHYPANEPQSKQRGGKHDHGENRAGNGRDWLIWRCLFSWAKQKTSALSEYFAF
jgi:hypothetical protein